jgi:hypothetical protein
MQILPKFGQNLHFSNSTQLVKAKLAMIEEPNDDAQGEVRYLESGLKYAEGKVEAARAKESEALHALQAHCNKVEDRRKDQWILEEYFIFH